MALPHELRFLGTTKGQLYTALISLLSFTLVCLLLIATMPASASHLPTHHALKLSVTSIKSAPTSKDYRKMDDDSVDGIKPDTYKLPKTPTLFLLYYSKTTRHAEAHSLVKKARFAAEHAGIGIYKFDCDQGPRADCDSYVLDEKLSSTAKNPRLQYYEDREMDEEYKFPVEDLKSGEALDALESWVRDQPKQHKARKAKRDKEHEERMKQYRSSGMGGMGGMGGYPGLRVFIALTPRAPAHCIACLLTLPPARISLSLARFAVDRHGRHGRYGYGRHGRRRL